MDSGHYIMNGHRCKASSIWSFVMLVSTQAGGLCCLRFIYPALCWFWCPKIGTSFTDGVQLTRLLPEDTDIVQSLKRF
jgi:hypothetical protein